MDTPINWGDIATWFTGIITFGLFIIGAIQIRHERILRKKREVEQGLQAIRSQAELISCWIAKESEYLWIAVSNQSLLPVYQVIVNIIIIGQDGTPRGNISAGQVCVAVAPPGVGYTNVVSDYHGMHRRPGVEIAFKDAAGRNWVRKSDGNLIGIEKSTVEYYEVTLPTEWRTLSESIIDYSKLG